MNAPVKPTNVSFNVSSITSKNGIFTSFSKNVQCHYSADKWNRCDSITDIELSDIELFVEDSRILSTGTHDTIKSGQCNTSLPHGIYFYDSTGA